MRLAINGIVCLNFLQLESFFVYTFTYVFAIFKIEGFADKVYNDRIVNTSLCNTDSISNTEKINQALKEWNI